MEAEEVVGNKEDRERNRDTPRVSQVEVVRVGGYVPLPGGKRGSPGLYP